MILIAMGLAILVAALLLPAVLFNRNSMEHDSKTKTTPRDFFLHAGIMTTLYISAISLLTLLFQIINAAFPDPLQSMYYYGSEGPYSAAVRWSVASLIVVFPILYFLARIAGKDYADNPAKRSMSLRKWLVYFTMFVAGLAIMIDLIVLINTFLGGEITTRFVLKVLAVLVVTGLVFGYYFYDLRHDTAKSGKMAKTVLGVSGLLILASIIAGFSVMGSPSKQRDAEFDFRKTSDLQGIQWQIVNYWQLKGELPASLSEVEDPISNYLIPNDPQTGEAYEYAKTGDLSFELCAVFNYPSEGNVAGRPSMPMPVDSLAYPGGRNDAWNHGEGRFCFERTIDPELYPPVDTTQQQASPVVTEKARLLTQ